MFAIDKIAAEGVQILVALLFPFICRSSPDPETAVIVHDFATRVVVHIGVHMGLRCFIFVSFVVFASEFMEGIKKGISSFLCGISIIVSQVCGEILVFGFVSQGSDVIESIACLETIIYEEAFDIYPVCAGAFDPAHLPIDLDF